MTVGIINYLLQHKNSDILTGNSKTNLLISKSHFNFAGVYALKDQDRAGRPTKLTGEQLAELKSDIEQGPQAFNFSQGFWGGPLLSYHIEQKYGVVLGVRQCQRLFRQLGYTLLRPSQGPPEQNRRFVTSLKNRMRP
jgi:transposase